MESKSRLIQAPYADKGINDLLGNLDAAPARYTRHFSQNEDFFIKLSSEFNVPPLPIHHDVKKPKPEREYLLKIKDILTQLVSLAPDVFQELTYFFDPSDILRPAFFRLYRIDSSQYLYLVKLDLLFRSQDDTVIEKGNNDWTPQYRTSNLFLSAFYVPLNSVNLRDGLFEVKQTVADTWKGERGRGYFAQGIWIDDDLTKFFSRVFLPQGKRAYPFYPFVCQYNTICQNLINLGPDDRRYSLPFLHRAFNFLAPSMRQIERKVRGNGFSEDHDIFKALKSKVPDFWETFFDGLKVETYLNTNDMREFRVELGRR
jgi:hypothetical protein